MLLDDLEFERPPRLPATTTHQNTKLKCMRLLCGAFGRHDEVNFTVEDMQQGYLLSQALTSVGGVEQSIQLRQRRPQASGEFAAA